MGNQLSTPVLLIAFNRPDTTQIAFDSIRKVKPKKLYVAIDGPRSDKLGEIDLCNQVLEITKNVDWECDAKYWIRKKNLGCKLGVTGAISWSMEKEDRIIIIEDDIVPVPAFFYFADELLEKYKNNERIAMISANQYTPIIMEDDYLFTKNGHIWGWATWKRVWDIFDVNVPGLEETVNNGLKDLSFVNGKECKYYKKYFSLLRENIRNKTENAWGPQFSFFRHKNNLLSIAPKVNLASNIGMSSSRTDDVSLVNKHYYPADDSFVLSKHPVVVKVNPDYESHHFTKHINKKRPLHKRIFKKIVNILHCIR